MKRQDVTLTQAVSSIAILTYDLLGIDLLVVQVGDLWPAHQSGYLVAAQLPLSFNIAGRELAHAQKIIARFI